MRNIFYLMYNKYTVSTRRGFRFYYYYFLQLFDPYRIKNKMQQIAYDDQRVAMKLPTNFSEEPYLFQCVLSLMIKEITGKDKKYES